MSALEFTSTLDNRIAVWALTNTSSLNTATPNVALSHVVIASEVYRLPAGFTAEVRRAAAGGPAEAEE